MGNADQDTTELPASTLLNDRYLLGRQLGEGGFGSVYLAQDLAMHGRSVVVKIQLRQSMDDPWFERKFSEEIRALSLIDHPGVVSAIDSGRTPEGKPFLVMQYVDGVTLRTLIKPEGMPLAQAAEILKQVGHALAAAHEKGIWHRDLKPENLMIQTMAGGGERVRLIDFGIATVADLAADLTATRITGSVLYMAPEQRMGHPSAAADIYAMGLIAYEMLTGRKPFHPETAGQITALQGQGVRLKPTALRPALGPATERLILQALEFEPSKRPADAREFGDKLYRSLLPADSATDVTRATYPAPSMRANRRWVWVTGVALLVSAAIGANYFMARPPANLAPASTPAVPLLPRPTPPDRNVETAFWDSMKDSTEPQPYSEYLAKYPNGQFAPLAAVKLANLTKPKAAADPDLEKDLWNVTKKSSEAEVYRAYLRLYPEGKHASAARKKLESLQKDLVRNDLVRRKIDDLPEMNYWNSIRKRNTAQAYSEYLSKYPQGKFSAIAQLKLSELGENLH